MTFTVCFAWLTIGKDDIFEEAHPPMSAAKVSASASAMYFFM